MRARRLLHSLLLVALCPGGLLAQPPNVKVSGPLSAQPEEVSIAINPTDPLNLVAGANINHFYSSSDGGLTWTEGRLQSSLGVWGDPVVVFDADGSCYFAHLSWPRVTGDDWLDRIVVQKSLDGGLSWSDGVGIGLNPPRDQDKEWLAVDLGSGPYRNNIYMAWTQFDVYDSSDPADSTRILFSRSVDHGVTWSTPLRISDRAGTCLDGDETVEGAVPAVGPNGEIYLAWSAYELLYFDRSFDGGVSFGTDTAIATQPGGWAFDVPGIYRCNGFPVTLCDTSWSPYRGHVYVVFSDQRAGPTDTDVYFVRSTDGGVSWSSPQLVAQETQTRHQFFPWACIDAFTGYLYVVYYELRGLSDLSTDVYVAQSQDGGAHWSSTKVSTTPFVPTETVFFGDYTGIAARRGKIYPLWMRMDGTTLSVWTALMDEPTGIGDPDHPFRLHIELAQNLPNPFNPVTTIRYELDRPAHATLTVYDLRGRRVRLLVDRPAAAGLYETQWDGRDAEGRAVASGVYLYRLSAGGLTESKRMVLLR